MFSCLIHVIVMWNNVRMSNVFDDENNFYEENKSKSFNKNNENIIGSIIFLIEQLLTLPRDFHE